MDLETLKHQDPAAARTFTAHATFMTRLSFLFGGRLFFHVVPKDNKPIFIDIPASENRWLQKIRAVFFGDRSLKIQHKKPAPGLLPSHVSA